MEWNPCVNDNISKYNCVIKYMQNQMVYPAQKKLESRANNVD